MAMNKHDKQHLRNLARIERMVEALFQAAATDAANLSSLIGELGEAAFSWDDYPLALAKINEIIDRLNSDVEAAIVNGVRSEWTLSNNKNNELCQRVFGSLAASLPASLARRYFSTNESARDAFLARRENGLNLSDNVWKYTNQFKSEIELALDVGIRSGRSADELSRDVREYLKNPHKLFRRVRDEHGQLQLSKNAAAYHPGRGVYRSSYMNARRLAATETNIAYRTADYLRWQQLDFVVGVEIHLSNNHNCKGIPAGAYYDICDELKGKYPKDFQFTGWHPHCRCYATSILKTDEELAADNERILTGEDVSEGSQNEVTTPPEKFNNWLNENAQRIDEARKHGTLPYFIRDNEGREWFSTAMASRYDDAYIANMRDKGIRFTDGLVSKMTDNPFNRLDVVKLNDNIQGVFAKHGVPDLSLNVAENRNGMTLVWRGQGVTLERMFYVDGEGRKVADHCLFTLSKELQGQGISKQVFRSLYEQYKVAGVQCIEVFANIDVGGYTWARYGFCAKDRDAAIGGIRFSALTTKQEKRIMALIDEHFATSSAPFPMNKIARLPYGKKALLGGDWDGVLDLTDTQQRRVFERYLRR